ncbi:hypothetical protein ACFRMQ_18270 [Kitasatospora sp. NPDC056783]
MKRHELAVPLLSRQLDARTFGDRVAVGPWTLDTGGPLTYA